MAKEKDKVTVEQTPEPRSSFTRDGVALILAALFVLGILFVSYRYFNDEPVTTDKDGSTAIEKVKDLISKNQDKESTDSKSTKTEEKTSDLTNQTGTTGTVGTDTTQNSTEQSGMFDGVRAWVANDYKFGDITGSTHTVIRGDTLWEISEGKYGDHYKWVIIRDGNSEKIGYLPNGEKALIFPEQVLVLPVVN